MSKTNKITSTTEVKRGKAEEYMLEAARERDHIKKDKYGIPGSWELFSINDLN